MRPIRFIAFVLASLVCASAACAAPQPFISPLFGDHMMLQRNKTNAIWGWAKPGDKVRVEITGRSAVAIAATDGRW